SLKPTSDSMDYMKSDMSGAAAVAATIYAVAKEKLPLHLVGLVPATDNRPGNNAYTPGDIITMYDGTTVEMLNADAEGRMILADALAYAAHYEPELIIELSTLTGAALMAVGPGATVGMGTASSGVFEKLIESGDNVGERIVQFPFWDEYEESLKSDIADIKNIGARYAGAITAGKFLAHFTKFPFVHLDIAGPAWTKETQDYKSKGGTGVGVRLLFDFFSKKVAGK
ncbi:MAG: M17 family metallopeptidase, partial [Bacteroidota bacterium]|nr:M17 family metallopeptidase [Bacteroidota bacterium]